MDVLRQMRAEREKITIERQMRFFRHGMKRMEMEAVMLTGMVGYIQGSSQSQMVIGNLDLL